MHHFLTFILTRLVFNHMKEEEGKLGKVTLPKGMAGLGIAAALRSLFRGPEAAEIQPETVCQLPPPAQRVVPRDVTRLFR